MSKQIAKAFTYVSSSGKGTYQTLKYADGSTSCDCRGWTRRVAPDGSRSCRHTRSVEMGRGEIEAISSRDYGVQSVSAPPALHQNIIVLNAELGRRKLALPE